MLCRIQTVPRELPHPILRKVLVCFWSFSVAVFGNVFFMLFHAFHLPFFNAFSMKFTCISHHFFGCFSGTFFQQLARRKSSFFKILLFERHAFYTVNTMVLRHSAHRKSSVPISQKNEKYHFFASFRHRFFIQKSTIFGYLNTVYERIAFLSFFSSKMAPKWGQMLLSNEAKK